MESPPFKQKTHQTDFLVFAPSLHDRRIIDTIDNDGMNSCFPESVLVFQVVRNLLCGSGRCKCPRQSNQQDRFVLGKIGQVVLFGWPSLMKFDAGKHVAHGSKVTRHPSRRTRRRSSSRRRHEETTTHRCSSCQPHFILTKVEKDEVVSNTIIDGKLLPQRKKEANEFWEVRDENSAWNGSTVRSRSMSHRKSVPSCKTYSTGLLANP